MTRTPLLLAACAALMVAGCTSGKDPGPNYSTVSTTPAPTTSPATPSSTPATSVSVPPTGPNSSPGEVAPTKPGSADSPTSDGALAFVTYYIKMSDWVFATSDTAILDPFYGPGCSTCRDAQRSLAELVAGGSHFEGGRIAIRTIAIVDNDKRQSADFAITSVSDVGATRVVSPTGTVTKTFTSSSGFQLTDWVRFVNGGWQIVEERKV